MNAMVAEPFKKVLNSFAKATIPQGRQIEIEFKDRMFLVDYSFSGKFIPARMYLSNGDPGYPAEYPDLDINSIKILHRGEFKEFSHTGILSQAVLDDLNEKIESDIWEAQNA